MRRKLLLFIGSGFLSLLLIMVLFVEATNAEGAIFKPDKPIRNIEYNWGIGSPKTGIPTDNFKAIFDQSGYYSSGDYFIQTLADDRVNMEVDGKTVIDRSGGFTGITDRALWQGVKAGNHKITTEYFEDHYEAGIFSHILPLNTWLAYYYSNQELDGFPTAAKVIQPVGSLGKLYEDHKDGSPAKGIPTDGFSARYSTAKKINAGDYIFRAKADDGVRVYLDGELVVDQWSNGAFREDAVKIEVSDREGVSDSEKNIHWIDVEYYDYKYAGKIEFILEPFKQATENTWVGEFYPNQSFEGNPYILGGNQSSNKISNINFDWKLGSPHSSARDNFTTRYTKEANFEDGSYIFSANADDGYRVYLDEKLIMDAWPNNGFKQKQELIEVSGGKHKIEVEYMDNTYNSHLSFNYIKLAEKDFGTVNKVEYNWKDGSPAGMPNDYFTTKFNQSVNLDAGNYFIQAFADDGVKVNVNDELLIDRISKYTGNPDRALLLDASKGVYDIETQYYEGTYSSGVFSHIVPIDSWLAYYYPTKDPTGLPTAAKIISPVADGATNKLYESHPKSPALGIPEDNFSARYTSAQQIEAGEYILHAKADDGVRVYVDGELVLDQWENGAYREETVKVTVKDNKDKSTNEQEIHWIEVEYYDYISAGKVEVYFEPLTFTDSWTEEYYPNGNLEGIPYIRSGNATSSKLPTLDFNWGNDSPLAKIPDNHFSARFTKKVNLDKGTYSFSAIADDGVRVYLDDEKIIDAWPGSGLKSEQKGVFIETSGERTLTVEYFEKTYGAYLTFDYEKISSEKVFYDSADSIHYDWGNGSPEGFPADNFKAIFDQSQILNGGDYFIQTFADGGVNVNVDGQTKLNRTSDSGGQLDQITLSNVVKGRHQITTTYNDLVNNASIYSHIAPFDSWVAYYYPNESLSGKPKASKVISPVGDYKALSESHGTGSPAPGLILPDNFSAVYRTLKKLPAGEYVLRTKADDGVRVYVDGRLIHDNWQSGSFSEDAIKFSVKDQNVSSVLEGDVHSVELHYHDSSGVSNLEAFIQPYEEVISTDKWIGYLYPNKTFEGNPMIIGGNGSDNQILTSDLNIDWGTGQPHKLIPADNFSAIYKKTVNMAAGKYALNLTADDSAEVYVDGEKVIDHKEAYDIVTLGSGQHKFEVRYIENTSTANLSLTITPIKGPIYLNANYNYTIDQMLDTQMSKGGPQTDLHTKYLREDALYKDVKGQWRVTGSGWNVRSGPGTNHPVVGTINNNVAVQILQTVKYEGQLSWYRVSMWMNALRSDVEIYANPERTSKESTNYFQFLKLSESAGLNETEVNNKILKGKGILENKASSFVAAGKTYGVNEIYLIAHALLETGNGTSLLSKGVLVSKVDGKAVEPKIVYNMYGIGAYDNVALTAGSEYAYKMGWTSPEKAIVGGAKFIAETYINVGQDTLYKMKWNPQNPGTHQYATDIGWPLKQVTRIKNLYDLITDYQLIFEKPVFK